MDRKTKRSHEMENEGEKGVRQTKSHHRPNLSVFLSVRLSRSSFFLAKVIPLYATNIVTIFTDTNGNSSQKNLEPHIPHILSEKSDILVSP